MGVWYNARDFKPRDMVEVYLVFEDEEIRRGYYSQEQKTYICQNNMCDPYLWTSIPRVEIAKIALHRSRGAQHWGVRYKNQKKHIPLLEEWSYEI